MNTMQDIMQADRPALVQQWQVLFDREPPAHVQVALLRRVLVWHAQDRALDVEPRMGKGMKRSGRTGHLDRVLKSGIKGGGHGGSASLSAGTRLLREWKGLTHEVLVLPQGFEHQGKVYTSLSAVAKAITGTPWSGPAFFGVKR